MRRSSWTDLLDPKWKGQIALPHPAFSGCGGVWALGLRKLYGWEYFEKLAKNNPRIGRSFGDPVTLMTAGECKVAPGPAQCILRRSRRAIRSASSIRATAAASA